MLEKSRRIILLVLTVFALAGGTLPVAEVLAQGCSGTWGATEVKCTKRNPPPPDGDNACIEWGCGTENPATFRCQIVNGLCAVPPNACVYANNCVTTGTPPPSGGPGNTCTGSCHAVANCGVLGRPGAAGSCSAGEVCCGSCDPAFGAWSACEPKATLGAGSGTQTRSNGCGATQSRTCCAAGIGCRQPTDCSPDTYQAAVSCINFVGVGGQQVCGESGRFTAGLTCRGEIGGRTFEEGPRACRGAADVDNAGVLIQATSSGMLAPATIVEEGCGFAIDYTRQNPQLPASLQAQFDWTSAYNGERFYSAESSALVFSGSWSEQQDAKGKFKRTSDGNASLSLAFSGNQLRLYFALDSRGRLAPDETGFHYKVILDGEQVDTISSQPDGKETDIDEFWYLDRPYVLATGDGAHSVVFRPDPGSGGGSLARFDVRGMLVSNASCTPNGVGGGCSLEASSEVDVSGNYLVGGLCTPGDFTISTPARVFEACGGTNVANLSGTKRRGSIDLEIGVRGWWQAINGSVLTNGDLISDIPNAIYELLLDGTGGFPGVAIFGRLLKLDRGDTVSSTNWQANTTYEGKAFTSVYFKNQIPTAALKNALPAVVTDFDGELAAAIRHGDYYWFVHEGDLTIRNPMTIAGDSRVIIFVDGDLRIKATVNITSPGNGFFMAVVGGDILVDPTVSTADGPELQGVFVTDGVFDTGEEGSQPLHVKGAVAAYGGFLMGRDIGALSSTTPAEVFEYDPALMFAYPSSLARERIVWKEVTP